MLAFDEALQIILDTAKRLIIERVDLSAATDRIVAEDITSDVDMPPFNKSAMDGYACRRADLAKELTIVENIPAGSVPKKTLRPNQCARIMTGSMVPEGADCVVKIEQTEQPTAETMRFIGSHTKNNICLKAEDVRAGQVVLRKGTQIMPQHIAALAAAGCLSVCVSRLPRVAVISTGDELVTPDKKPALCQIRDTNSHQLCSQAGQTGAIVTNYGIVPDKKNQIERILRKAIADNDVVILSGGVSMGDYDFVIEIMSHVGIDIRFQKVAVKPGRPTVFGTYEDTCCFGLPGNPVASFVIFELFVKSLLYKLMGHNYCPMHTCVPLASDLTIKKSQRQTWIPAEITEDMKAKPVEYHGTANITALCEADGLISIDKEVVKIDKGTIVKVRLIRYH